MRITNGMLSRLLLADVDRTRQDLASISEQMASGRRIQRASDDPLGTGRVLELEEMLARTGQHRRNAGDARTWLDATDTALGQMTDLTQRARELALRGANSTFGQVERESIALEVDQLVDAVKAEGNASYAGRYLFGGTKTDQPPYLLGGTDDAYYGDAGTIDREVSAGVSVRLNVTGTDAVGSGPGGLLAALRKLASDLRAGDVGAVGGADLAAISGHLDTLIGQRALVGARTNRVDLAASRVDELELSLKKLQSETADADLAALAMGYSMRSSALQAALQAGAKMIQPTLMDFLD
ncbi:flagellar hook-associated protein 3 [Gaiella occulta]|uniref:Flagellar hook-associated protein 3 n=1 Tax=Gaiella occulta TaxID=1002870 RepID=A0A7M2Z1S8_9ACTN|nr:flagellar hook-associated protein FlgL [Gaiella occulta]RDI76015.1 flagellar hook-associated protein 3 [Gaiella occulta]